MQKLRCGDIRTSDNKIFFGTVGKTKAGIPIEWWMEPEQFREAIAKRRERDKARRERDPAKHAEANKAWHKANAERVAKRKAEAYLASREEQLRRNREYHKTHREEVRVRHAKYRKENPEKIRAWKESYRPIKNARDRELSKSDPIHRARDNARERVRRWLFNTVGRHQGRLETLFGCSPSALREHFQSKFRDGMTWDNHGTFWEVDHIIPLISAKTQAELDRLNHYTNLQPLLRAENSAKGHRQGVGLYYAPSVISEA